MLTFGPKCLYLVRMLTFGFSLATKSKQGNLKHPCPHCLKQMRKDKLKSHIALKHQLHNAVFNDMTNVIYDESNDVNEFS